MPEARRARVLLGRGARVALALMATGLLAPCDVPGQATSTRTSFVVATGDEATAPVPTLHEGANSSIANSDVADQLFARLGQLTP